MDLGGAHQGASDRNNSFTLEPVDDHTPAVCILCEKDAKHRVDGMCMNCYWISSTVMVTLEDA